MKARSEYIGYAVENIARYYEKETSIGERMSLNLAELSDFVAAAAAKEVRSRGFFADGSLASYLPTMPDIADAAESALPENAPLIRAKLAAAEGAYLADFCQKTTAALRVSAKLKPSPALFAPRATADGSGRVSFAESRVLSTAFAAFRAKDTTLEASYVHSFSDACEDVASGESEYCILPIENSREGVLPTVYGLIGRYELFIARVCGVESAEITTKFALLCRGRRGIIDSVGRQYVALRLSGQDASQWSRLYTGAEVLGVEAVNTVSVPLGYTDGYAHICTFAGSSEALFALLLFLGTVRVGYTLMGAYEIL